MNYVVYKEDNDKYILMPEEDDVPFVSIEKSMITAINEYKSKQQGLSAGWINAKEKLPEEDVEVLGYTKYEYDDNDIEYFMDVVRYIKGDWLQESDEVEVTHWMPLPDKPVFL